MIHRRKPPNTGLWNGIGGKVEPGEDPFAACIREVREETGLVVDSPRLRALLAITVRSSGDLWVIFVFTAPAPGTALAESEEGELAWVAMEGIPSLPTPPDLPVLLPHLLNDGDVVVVRFEYDTEDASSVVRAEILGP